MSTPYGLKITLGDGRRVEFYRRSDRPGGLAPYCRECFHRRYENRKAKAATK